MQVISEICSASTGVSYSLVSYRTACERRTTCGRRSGRRQPFFKSGAKRHLIAPQGVYHSEATSLRTKRVHHSTKCDITFFGSAEKFFRAWLLSANKPNIHIA